ncbi:MAG: UDP-2,3-diacylglucosamine diphosphatase [Candidatus Krumholzibacteria bacterium]|nr:UDP-2,3-diacylglucosamine diphosphatase [Candidatus Krumholzibacteria bacterium]
MNDTVYFLSDTHFTYHTDDLREREKRRLFLEFLVSIRRASRLYLVGDIFDFWFEYRSVVPRYYAEIVAGLAGLASSGTHVLIMGGNHDHWFGGYLREAAGAEILPDRTVHELQGHRVLLTHGDSLMRGDLGYKALKTVIRSRPAVALARLIHPDLLYAFAAAFSRSSKSFTHRKTLAWADALTAIAESEFFKAGNDTLVMGHVHLPRLRRFGERTFVILGDWETHRSYLRLTGGEFSLEAFQNEGNTLIENR